MSTARVAVLDAGGANLGSVRAAFARLGIEPEVTVDAEVAARATHLVLPGVGAAAPVAERLRATGLERVVREAKVPLLGICVGMQVLFEGSDEGEVEGLGLFRGRVQRLSDAARVPHMGWNRLAAPAASPLLDGVDGAHAYFVHSYAAPASPDAAAWCAHGPTRFVAASSRGLHHGVQFHPERSGAVGARVLTNFLGLRA